MATDWDDAYANSAHIPGAEQMLEALPKEASAFRARAVARLDLSYDRGEREKLDLFLPRQAPEGLFVFVHGGYWMLFDKSAWSHLSAGATGNGWAAAIPSYDLCPQVRIGQIVRQTAAAIAEAARLVTGPIVIAGHSAGGHLVARMMCGGRLLPEGVFARLRRVAAISGLFDLRQLLRTAMNATLQLDVEEARRESPALLEPLRGPEFVAWVGARERPEFLRQSALIANIWSGFDVSLRQVIAPERHHFNVIAPLAEPHSDLVQALLAD